MSVLDRPGRVGVFSSGIARIPHLRALLGASAIVLRPGRLRSVDCVVGWGRKPNTAVARRYAAARGVPFLALEDGFLRSIRPGVTGEPPRSIVIDDLGIYYASEPGSRLERILAEDEIDDATRARACRAIARIRAAGLSKYNDAPPVDLGPRARPRVLVIDQTAGDLSIALGGAVGRPFETMLEAALDEHRDAEIVVKTHPDVALGKKRGHFARLPRDRRIRVLAEACQPASLFSQVDRVYAVTSLVGLEALVHGLPVTCFGAPFYAGWGATDDRAPMPSRRGRPRTVEEIVAAAYLRYARYVDPETGERCEIERTIEQLAIERATGEENRGRSVCVGFSLWKRGFIPSFLSGPGSRVEFAWSERDAARRLARAPGARLVVWGTRERESLRAIARSHGAPIWRIEDGFLRSVGLGSDLHAPASLVVDRDGMYYDPRTPSALETILERGGMTEDELARARALRERIVRAGLSKYNLGERRRVAAGAGSRPVVLVVGQVEDDASIRLGCLDVRENEQLLRCAREARPDAYVVWKPHPDVLSGNRRGGVPRERALALADEIVEDAALADCLAAAAEVHTMTSLVGFEALMRGIPVAVYGQPFYAGWGLTTDRHPHPRRTRRISLDELVCGALVRYPRYVSLTTGRATTPETIVDQLLVARARAGAGAPWRSSWPVRQSRKLALLVRGVARAS